MIPQLPAPHMRIGGCTSCFSLYVFLSLALLMAIEHPPWVESTSDYTNLLYRGCGSEALRDPTGQSSEALKSLLESLVAQSSRTSFFTSNNASGTESGLFQCRGDLSNDECHDCVNQAQQIATSVCGEASAARIQFDGCYLLYASSGVILNYGSELLYKSCSTTDVAGAGFQERRDMALKTMSDQVSKKHGFYTTVFESVYVLAQCEGDISDDDCSECVKTAVQRAQVECGSSIAGQAYLHKCFITYNYSPNGVPRTSSISSPSGSGNDVSGKNKRSKADFILICAAVAGVVLLCMVLVWNRKRK